METGEKRVIMEDLSDFVDSGALFGPGNPNNWSRELRSYEERAGRPEPARVAEVTFRAYARLHARYWRDEKLLGLSWLRGAEWVSGENRRAFEESQSYAQAQWKRAKESLQVQQWFDPLVFAAVEKTAGGVSWERQQQRLNRQSHWTLVHGDCWPGNVMWHREGRVKLVDWEMAGVGSGPQDLGQYVISNMEPAVRRECERRIVGAYFAELEACGVRGHSFDECWREYTVGGTERWLWFLCYFAGTEGMRLDQILSRSSACLYAGPQAGRVKLGAGAALSDCRIQMPLRGIGFSSFFPVVSSVVFLIKRPQILMV